MSSHVAVLIVCLLVCLAGPLWAANDDVEMVPVPAGEFTMGGAGKAVDEDAQERPEHKITLPDFSIDKTEVTTAQYCKFLYDAVNFKHHMDPQQRHDVTDRAEAATKERAYRMRLIALAAELTREVFIERR